ncbi:MAG: nucleotidyltransferase domain-containing protein [Anaerolineales bacterium]|nr:nucleotidyltransferase domain-containing protein [Anaerolineales bacterium]
MTIHENYPGTPKHQALLAAIVAHYARDPRVLAISVFGSLSRGNWDQYSDLDLDIVIADDVRLNAQEELRHLGNALAAVDQQRALIVADGSDAGDVVFESLTQMSIRYHPLATTHPNIVDTLQILMTKLDPMAIKEAGLANRRAQQSSLGVLLDRCVRYVVVTDVALQRHHLWSAVEMLHRIRGLLMELYALGHDTGRSLPVFQTGAPAELQLRLGRTLPLYDLSSLHRALEQCLDILEQDLARLTRGQIQLADVHHQILAHVRVRQTQLRHSS